MYILNFEHCISDSFRHVLHLLHIFFNIIILLHNIHNAKSFYNHSTRLATFR